jgi:hypothetical protein
VVDVTGPSPYPANPIKRVCNACEVVSSELTCWICGAEMFEPENQKAATLVRLAGCKSDEPEFRQPWTPPEPRRRYP